MTIHCTSRSEVGSTEASGSYQQQSWPLEGASRMEWPSWYEEGGAERRSSRLEVGPAAAGGGYPQMILGHSKVLQEWNGHLGMEER
jgi:hypothetical protein